MVDRSVSQINELVTNILANKKYSSILPGLVKTIGENELQRRHNLKDAIKETKTKLHLVSGVYLEDGIKFDHYLNLLKNSPKDDAHHIKDACRQILAQHTSTRERLVYLDTFYPKILKSLPPFSKILDIACGLNPITIPWMGLRHGQEYTAWDVNVRMVEFLTEAIKYFDVPCKIEAVDILSVKQFPEMDLVFLLKTLPCLEQIQKGFSPALLNQIAAKIIIVSFPSKSLGGTKKGMEQHYNEMMQKWLVKGPWKAEQIIFPGETVYVLSRR